MDDLKKYLQQNRDDLDLDSPREMVWENIRRQSIKKPSPVRVVLRYAAAAAMLIIVGVSIKWALDNNKRPAVEISKDSPVENVPDSVTPVFVHVPHSAIIPVNVSTNRPASEEEARNKAIYEIVNVIGKSYEEVVKLQLSSIRATPLYANEPGYFDAFKTELQQMDALEIMVRKSIKTNGPDDRLIEQLINVYQHKLDLLKTLRAEINKMNERVKQYQIPSDSTKTFYLDI